MKNEFKMQNKLTAHYYVYISYCTPGIQSSVTVTIEHISRFVLLETTKDRDEIIGAHVGSYCLAFSRSCIKR